jgi:Heavy metal binding domain
VSVALRAGHLALVLILCVAGTPAGSAQTPVAPPAPELQTEAIWTCPVHAVVAEKGAGKCPICRRDLVPVTATVTWTCADRPEIDRPAPGKCSDGSSMEPRYTQSTHANHNPRHGGLFFMAPDLWHHLEGAYQQDETFRVYLYDDYTKPLPPDLARQVSGRIVMKETFDSATRATKELAAAPLAMAANGEYLEAHVGRIKLPAEMTAKVKFTRDAQEYRFDFTFPEYSTDASAAPGAATPSLFEVPDDATEILRLLDERVTVIGDLVRKGAFSEVWVPAFHAKDLALALDVRTRTLPQAVRPRATMAVEQVVRAAWAIDAAGDTGNRGDVEDAYAALVRGAADVKMLYRAGATGAGR